MPTSMPFCACSRPPTNSSGNRHRDAVCGQNSTVKRLFQDGNVALRFHVRVANVSHLDASFRRYTAAPDNTLTYDDVTTCRDFCGVHYTTDGYVALGADMKFRQHVAFNSHRAFALDASHVKIQVSGNPDEIGNFDPAVHTAQITATLARNSVPPAARVAPWPAVNEARSPVWAASSSPQTFFPGVPDVGRVSSAMSWSFSIGVKEPRS